MHGNPQEQRELAGTKEEDGLVPEDQRSFFEDGVTADEYPAQGVEEKAQLQEESDEKSMQRLRNEMAPLENLERTLADQYKMGRDFDPVDVLYETQARAQDHPVSQCELAQLIRLQSLRCDFSAIEQKSPHSNRSLSSPPPQIDPSRFWAVLIGINGYKDCPLKGSVADALSMRDYLMHDLGVPEEHIQCLLGPAKEDYGAVVGDALIPTRKNIIETICGLIHNPNILKGDVIIIYFSGIGTRLPCPEYYQHGGVPEGFTSLTECLVPIDAVDVDIRGRVHTNDSSLLISDREINIILTELCREKGHRITFIVDSNYTGGFRSFPGDKGSRYHTMGDYSTTAMFDDARKFPRHVSRSSRNWYPDMGSYVTLTGAQENQNAWETNGGGIFTQALIRTLKSNELKSTSNYIDLLFQIMPLLPHFSATPFAFGKHIRHRLWYQD